MRTIAETPWLYIWGGVLLVLGLVAGALLGVARERVMQANRVVEVAIGSREVLALASKEGIGPADLLLEFRRRGATAIVLESEEGNTLPPGLSLEEVRRTGMRPILGVTSHLPAELPPGGVIYCREELPRSPDEGRAFLDSLNRQEVVMAFNELHPPEGLVWWAARTTRFLRLHELPAEETVALGLDAAQRRLLRAVRERGVRLLYLHLLVPGLEGQEKVTLSPETAAGWNERLLQGVVKDLHQAHYLTGRAVPYAPLDGSYKWFLPILAGVSGAGIMALARRFGLWTAVGGALFFALSSFLWGLGYPILARQAVALVAAILFPTWGVLVTARVGTRQETSFPMVMERLRGCGFLFKAAGQGVVLWLLACGFSLAGGLLVAGALTDRLFLLQAAGFRGVKVALLLPLGLVWWSWRDWGRKQEGSPWCRQLPWWQRVVVGGLLLIAAGIYLIRSGNYTWFPVPAVETALRLDLETLFGVRPRFKEFVGGHPFLITGLGLLVAGWPWQIVRWLLFVGTIGQVSLVNTFAHLHTPWSISWYRTGVGMLLGLILGLVGLSMVLWWTSREAGGEGKRVARGHQWLLRL